MLSLTPETYLWLDHARTAEHQQRADRYRHAAFAAARDPQQPVDAPPPAEVEIVEASPAMAEDLRRFLRRLSATTTYRRFLTPAISPSAGDLDRLLRADDASRALVARRDGVIVGHAMAVRVQTRDAVDIGIVVADQWQHRGIGKQLFAGLLATCPAAGAGELELEVAASNDPVRRMIRRYWPGAVATLDGTVIDYLVPVSGPAPASSAVPAPSPAVEDSALVLCGAGDGANR